MLDRNELKGIIFRKIWKQSKLVTDYNACNEISDLIVDWFVQWEEESDSEYKNRIMSLFNL